MGVAVDVGVKVTVGRVFGLLMDISVETSSVGWLEGVLGETDIETVGLETAKEAGFSVGGKAVTGVGFGGGTIFLKKGSERLPK